MKKSERHGHVARNSMGAVCECGGPTLCQHCRAEISAHIGPVRGSWYAEAWDLYNKDGQTPETFWAMRTAELAVELAKVSAALRDVLATTGRYPGTDREKQQARSHAEKVLIEVEVER